MLRLLRQAQDERLSMEPLVLSLSKGQDERIYKVLKTARPELVEGCERGKNLLY